MELLNIDPAKSFVEKLNDLWSSGKIGQSEKDTLLVLSDAGSAAAHRGGEATIEQLDIMMDIIEAFCHRNFLLNDKVGGCFGWKQTIHDLTHPADLFTIYTI